MKINTTPELFPDYVVNFLLQCIMEKDDENFIPVADNENFKKLIEQMDRKGLKSILLKYFLGMDAKIKTNYKYFKRVFEPVHSDSEILSVQQDLHNDTHNLEKNTRNRFTGKKKKQIKDQKELIDDAVRTATQMITEKVDPNPTKLKTLQENVYNHLKYNGKL